MMKKKLKSCLIGVLFIGLAGVYFASRQIWLQSLPHDAMPACLPAIDVLIRYFPWTDVVSAFLWGSADCTEITWQWLGLSLPMWSVVYFISVFCATAVVYYRYR